MHAFLFLISVIPFCAFGLCDSCEGEVRYGRPYKVAMEVLDQASMHGFSCVFDFIPCIYWPSCALRGCNSYLAYRERFHFFSTKVEEMLLDPYASLKKESEAHTKVSSLRSLFSYGLSNI